MQDYCEYLWCKDVWIVIINSKTIYINTDCWLSVPNNNEDCFPAICTENLLFSIAVNSDMKIIGYISGDVST